MSNEDYYSILGVEKDADPRQIRDAYRQLAFRYHPDQNKDDTAASEKMKQVNEAYAVLSNPAKRSEYDALREQFGPSAYSRFRRSYSQQDIFRGSDIHQVFEEISRAFGMRGFEDIFQQVYGQGFRRFEFKGPGVNARGFVFTGSRGRASPFSNGSPLGNITHRLLEKISGIKIPKPGKDIHDAIYLNPELAGQGGPYAYYHKARKKKLIVNIPAGVRSGQRIRLAEMGQAGEAGAHAGDLYLKVEIIDSPFKKLKQILAGILK